MKIRFNRPYRTGKEVEYIRQAQDGYRLSGNGPFTQKCQSWLEKRTGAPKVLLTHSCTAALEMAALLLDLRPGDEVIMPSYTFVSTANAFVLRGAVPVFVDIRRDTLNLDETKIEAAITPKTRAIVAVHYAGVACAMDKILEIAKRRSLLVIEDAAQGIGATYRGKPLGGIGHLAAYSFHETKNIISGEGGALLVNDPSFVDRSQVLWEKGTNRNQFFKGEVDKYTWVDLGSSFLPNEMTAAFLWAQLEEAEGIQAKRMAIWERYHQGFAQAEAKGLVRRPIIPAECGHNAHLYYLLLPSPEKRDAFLQGMNKRGINAIFHYIPLHDSPAGAKFGRVHGSMDVTQWASQCIARLPFWIGLEEHQDQVIQEALKELGA
jgi:dTDP-4-amino-4,6-dideoxygalactose transaminase